MPVPYAFAFLSGFLGLVYEILWRRALVPVMGATPAATATVLAAFMAGLALGACAFGLWAEKTKNPAGLLVVLRAALAFLSLPLVLVLLGLAPLMGFLAGTLDEVQPFFLIVRSLICFLLLAFPAALLGGSWPVLAKISKAPAGRLYAAQALGALAGALATGFFLLEVLGLPGCALLTAALDASLAWTAYKAWGDGEKQVAILDGIQGWKMPVDLSLDRAGLLVFSGGFAVLGLEVCYERVLVLVFGASPYAFSLMLGAALLGLGGGSWAGAGLKLTRGAAAALAWVLLALSGLLSGLSLIPASKVRELHPWLADLFGAHTWAGWAGLTFLESLLILGPAFFLLGAVFPVVLDSLDNGVQAARLGGLSAYSTAGSVLGALAAGFLLIPALGTTGSLLLISFLSLGTALILAVESRFQGRVAAVSGLALGASLLVWGPGLVPEDFLIRSLAGDREEMRLLFAKEGRGGTVTVEAYPGYRTLSVDGVNVAGGRRGLRMTQKFQAHLPALLGAERPRVLQVGYGSGETTRILGLYGAETDLVEINPDIVATARRYFPDLAGEGRARVHIADAAAFVRARGPAYDLILNDSIHPSLNGNAELYSSDYFLACRRRLSPGGLLSTWLPLFGLGPRDLRCVIRDFTDAFPDSLLFVPMNAEPRHALLLGWKGEGTPPMDLGRIRKRLRAQALIQDLAPLGWTGAESLLQSFVVGGEKLRALGAGVSPSTEAHPRLEFTSARSFGDDHLILGRNLEFLLESREPLYPYLSPGGDLEACRRLEKDLRPAFDSGTWLLRALSQSYQGRPEGVEQLIQKAAELDPRNPAPDFFMQDLGRERQALRQKAAENPGSAQARYDFGLSLWKKGELDQAEREFQASLSADKNSFEARLSLGHVHALLGQWKEAERDYDQALDLDPGSLAALRGLRRSLQQDGDFEGALKVSLNIMKLAGPSAEEWNQVGLIQNRLGRNPEAEASFQKALALDPAGAGVYNNLGILRHQSGDLKGALEAFEKAAQAQPDQKESYANIATLALRLEDFSRAEQACRQALELDPSWAFAEALLGAALKSQGKGEEARRAWKKALELDPRQPQALDWLARDEEKPKR